MPATKKPTATKSWTRKGCRYLAAEHRVDFIFECPGLATDGKGKPAPAGLILKVTLKPGFKAKTPAHYLGVVKELAAKGVADLGIGPNRMTPITWAKYCREGYDH